jgi:hypothetical protein
MPHLDPDVCGGPATAVEKRRHARHVCLDGGVLRLAVHPKLGGARALLMDVSAGGIGFLSGKPLEKGCVLAMQVGDAEGGVAGPLVALVVHARPHPAPADAPWRPPRSPVWDFLRGLFGIPADAGRPAESAWFIGCQFTRPLTEEELRDLLRRLNMAPPSEPEA